MVSRKKIEYCTFSGKNSPSSACSSHSTNFFICSIKTVHPRAEWVSLYHFNMASSETTSAKNETKIHFSLTSFLISTQNAKKSFIVRSVDEVSLKNSRGRIFITGNYVHRFYVKTIFSSKSTFFSFRTNLLFFLC